jgi:hypothetical protein
MIKNERQYRLTKSQVEHFEHALAEMRESSEDQTATNPILHQAIINGTEPEGSC